jgi:hypothetical protein
MELTEMNKLNELYLVGHYCISSFVRYDLQMIAFLRLLCNL